MKTIHLNSVDSTNTYLKQNYKSLENYTFVSADRQTEGRGRTNRNWESENGKNLLFSLLILDKELIKHFKEISIVSAYSILEVLKDLGIKDLSIKWPNDVYVKDNKICGILLESVCFYEIDCLIVGVGLNVNQKDFNGSYRANPTSIYNELGKEYDLDFIKEKVYKKLLDNLNDINRNYYEEITKYDYLKGKNAYALINDKECQINVIGINKDYSLRILNDDKEIDIEAGEITFHL